MCPAYFDTGFSVRQPMWHGMGYLSRTMLRQESTKPAVVKLVKGLAQELVPA